MRNDPSTHQDCSFYSDTMRYPDKQDGQVICLEEDSNVASPFDDLHSSFELYITATEDEPLVTKERNATSTCPSPIDSDSLMVHDVEEILKACPYLEDEDDKENISPTPQFPPDPEPWQLNTTRLPTRTKLTRKLLPTVTYWWWATQLDDTSVSACKRKRPYPESPALTLETRGRSRTRTQISSRTGRVSKAVHWRETDVTDVRYRPIMDREEKQELFYDGVDYSRFRQERNDELMQSQKSYLRDICESIQGMEVF